MRSTGILIALAAFMALTLHCGVTGWLVGSEPEKPGGTPTKDGNAHAFVCTDYSQGKVFIISTEG